MEWFIPLLPNEKTIVLMNQHKQVAQYVMGNYDGFKELIHQIAASKSGQLASQASSVIMQNVKVSDITTNANWKNQSSEQTFSNKLLGVKGIDMGTTQNRTMVYRTMVEYLPENLGSGSATETLRVLETLLSRSNRETIISQMPELPRMFSHVVATLEKAGVNWKGLVDQKTVIHKLNDVNTFLKQSQGISNMRGIDDSSESPSF